MAQEMGFWDHAEALRGVLLRIVALIVVLSCALFAVMPFIFDSVILAPCRQDFILYRYVGELPELMTGSGTSAAGDGDFEVKLISIRLASQFFVHVSASLWLSVVIAFPLIVYMLWRFVAPGLYESEKRGVGKAFLGGCVMFFVGVAVGYFLVFPLTLRFLADYRLNAMISNEISLDSYMDNFMTLILVMGIVFELPVVAWLIGKTGLLKRDFFHRFRRHAIVVLLIAAAVITPTGDPFTLLVVFLPLYILWELSALTVKNQSAES